MVLKRMENASQEKQGQPPTSPLRKNRVPGPGGVMLRALVPGARDIFDVHRHQGLGKTFGTQASTSSGFTMPRLDAVRGLVLFLYWMHGVSLA